MGATAPLFWLGVHRPAWLAQAGVPLFVSHRTLRDYRTLPRAAAPWALDSGGFTELTLHGEWQTPPAEYVAAVRRYRDEVGQLAWASPQDWMVEPAMLTRTGLTVAEHQRRTVENYLTLKGTAPDLPFIPVLQGWDRSDYLRCADMYEAAGVDLASLEIVGVGSVVSRQDAGSADVIVTALADRGYALHGFGVKLAGLGVYGHALTSADSMAWSYRARRAAGDREALGLGRPPCGKRTCSNCLHFALEWRHKALRAGSELDQQLALPM